MVNTIQKPIIDTHTKTYNRYTQKKNRERNPNKSKDRHKITKGESKRRRKEQKRTTKQPENSEQNGNKYKPISNHFKCNWNNDPVKIHRAAEWT